MPRAWAVVAALVACIAVAALLLREPIGRWVFPDRAVAGLLVEAERALTAGELDAAVTGFRAAQARSPDHPRVVEGLARTRDLALADAEAATARGDLDRARRNVELAAALGAPGERIADLQRRIAERSAPSVEDLLRRAIAAETADPDAALAIHLDVLRREPGNALALAGRTRLLGAQLAEAAHWLEAGDVERARKQLVAVQAIDPGHLALPELKMRLGAAGAVDLDAPPASTPPSIEAKAEAARWRGLAEEALGRGAHADARRALDEARRLEPDAVDLARLEERWLRAIGQPVR